MSVLMAVAIFFAWLSSILSSSSASQIAKTHFLGSSLFLILSYRLWVTLLLFCLVDKFGWELIASSSCFVIRSFEKKISVKSQKLGSLASRFLNFTKFFLKMLDGEALSTIPRNDVIVPAQITVKVNYLKSFQPLIVRFKGWKYSINHVIISTLTTKHIIFKKISNSFWNYSLINLSCFLYK